MNKNRFLTLLQTTSSSSSSSSSSAVILLSNLSRIGNETRPKCAESYCLPVDYDKLEVPFNDGGVVKVSVDLDVLQVSYLIIF